MSNGLKHLMNGKTKFKQRKEPLSESEREKVRSLSAKVETGTSKKLAIRCFLGAALFMCVLQSAQIAQVVDRLSPNLVSDSIKVVTKEWHRGMENLGIPDYKDNLFQQIKNILPELNSEKLLNMVEVKSAKGERVVLRGASGIKSEFHKPVHKEEHPRALTRFGQYKFRGSF